MEKIRLNAGERVKITENNNFLVVQSGIAEIYAVLKENPKIFRQSLLMERREKEPIFPTYDEFERLESFVYALTDCELIKQNYNEVTPLSLQESMTDWLKSLTDLSWVKSIIDNGDEELKKWRNKQIFDDTDSDNFEVFEAVFKKESAIFSMLQVVRFHSENKQAEKRLGLYERQQTRLKREAIGALLGKKVILYEEDEVAQASSAAGEIFFLIRAVLKHNNMPYNGLSIPADTVKKLSVNDLLFRLAQKGNLGLRSVTLKKNWYAENLGSFIVRLTSDDGKNQIAAVLPDSENIYKLLTKEHPDGIPLTPEIAKKIQKDAFQCYAGFVGNKLTISELLRFVIACGCAGDYRAVLFAGIFAGIIPLLGPIITETMFQDILPIVDYGGLVAVTSVMTVAGFAMTTITAIRSVALMRISLRVNMDTEAAFILRLLSLPEKFFRQFSSGELVNRIKSLENIKNIVNDNFAIAALNLLFSLFSVALMCWYSLPLTIAAVCLWLLWCNLIIFIYKRISYFRQKYIVAKNKQIGIVQQIFTGLAKFRIHGAEEQAYNIWSNRYGETVQNLFALRRYDNYVNIINSIQPFVLTIIIYYIAFYITKTPESLKVTVQNEFNGLSYAEFLAFEYAYTAFNITLAETLPAVGRLFSIKPHIENLKPLLDEIPEQKSDKIEADVLSGAIEVSHLTFAYNDDQPNILQDISFKIAPRENIAIVGKSGCGKSTLVRLLLGFEQPKTGAIYYDGLSLADLSLSSVRSQMGVVLQNGQLIAGDIFSNIAGQKLLTEDEVWAAAEAAGIAEDIDTMPMKMRTIVNEGGNNISGGQKQRIMIARALALNPAILIFDEATSALDNKSQAIVTANLNKLNITRIIIAHRLSTVECCDRILVMDKGRIVESGSFNELMNKNGFFSKLVKRQLV